MKLEFQSNLREKFHVSSSVKYDTCIHARPAGKERGDKKKEKGMLGRSENMLPMKKENRTVCREEAIMVQDKQILE